MQHVCERTGLHFVLVGRAPNLLPRSLDSSVNSQSGILSQGRESSHITVPEIWAVHRWVRVDDFLVLARSARINGIVVLKGGSRLPCFACPWSLITSHVFLRKPLLYSLRFPVIVSDPPPVLNHPGTKLSKHGLGSDDGDLP